MKRRNFFQILFSLPLFSYFKPKYDWLDHAEELHEINKNSRTFGIDKNKLNKLCKRLEDEDQQARQEEQLMNEQFLDSSNIPLDLKDFK